MSHFLFLTTMFVFCFLRTGTALKCYTCTTMTNQNCNDPVDTTKLDTLFCNERNYGCMKEVSSNDGRIIHRGCTPTAYCEILTALSDHCSVCTSDLCNSSFVTRPSNLLFLILIAIAILMK